MALCIWALATTLTLAPVGWYKLLLAPENHTVSQGLPLPSPHLLVFVVVQLLSCVWALCNSMDYRTRHTPLSFTVSWRLLKLMCIESVMPSNHPSL